LPRWREIWLLKTRGQVNDQIFCFHVFRSRAIERKMLQKGLTPLS
jgi:hypothetical protein